MAAAFKGNEYTLTSAVVTLTTALGLTTPIFFSHAAFRAGKTNAADIYIGKSTVTTSANRLVYLDALEAFEFALESQFISSDELYIAGTANDVLHIAVVI